ncbi:MAG: pyridoxal phosphate-dependent aminotransferase [bacterium]
MPDNFCDQFKSFLVMDILEKACELEACGKEVIHMEVGQPDFDTPECVKEAAYQAIRDRKIGYTHSLGILELREAICAYYHRTYGVEVHPGQVVVTPGTSPAMLLAAGSLLRRGDRVLLTDPHYACYPNFIRFVGAEPVFHRVCEGDGFQFTAAELDRMDTDPYAAVMLNSPSNPTGTLMNEDALQAACASDMTVLSDEIYHGLVYEGRERSALEFTDDCFVFNGFSKLFAMTGWRLGYMIAPKRHLPLIQKLQQSFVISTNSVAQWAGIAALTEAGEDVARMKAVFNTRRLFLIDALKRLGFSLAVEPKGAFYVFVNASHLDTDSVRLAFDILDKAHVGVTPGVDFGPGGEGFLRFSYATSMENIEEAMVRLEKYLSFC